MEWTDAGTKTGPGITGETPTGTTMGVNGVSVFKFTPEGLAKEEREYADFPTMLAQLGLSNEKGRPIATPPTGAPEVHIAKGTPEEDQNVAIAKTVQATFERHDVKRFADATADGATWEDLRSPGPTFGKEGLVANFTMMTKAFPDLRVTCESWGIEDFLIEECTMSGTNKGPIVAPGMKLTPTNKSVSLHSVNVIQMKDGKAVNGRSYGNRAEMLTSSASGGRRSGTRPTRRRRRPSRTGEGAPRGAPSGDGDRFMGPLEFAPPPRACQISAMADRYPSFFGPVLPRSRTPPKRSRSRSSEQIRGRRIEADMQRTAPQIWADGGRRSTNRIPSPAAHTPQPPNGGGTTRLRIVAS